MELRRHLGLIFRTVVSLLLIAWLIARVDWWRFWLIIRTVNAGWLIAGFFSSAPVLGLVAWRWRLLLGIHDVRLRFWRVFELTMIGQFFSAFLIGTTGGDMVKILYVARAAPERKAAASFSVIVDRVIGLIALLLLGVALSATQLTLFLSKPGPRAATIVFYLLALGGVAASFAACLGPLLSRRPFFRSLVQRIPFLHYGTPFFSAYERTARAIGINFLALLGSVAAHLWTTLKGYCVLRSLHLSTPPPLLAFCAILAIVNVLISLPVSISGLGLRETLFVMFFSLLGLDKEHAIAFSISYFGLNVLWSLLGGPVYFLYRHEPLASLKKA